MPRFDTIVVGAGIIGGAIARELARDGQRVLLLDRGEPGREASWAAAGMLSPAPESPEAALVELGRASLEIYGDFIAEVEAATRMNCGYRHEGAIEVFCGEDAEVERDAFAAEHRRLQLTTEAITLQQARKMEPGIGPAARAAAWLPYEASVEPRMLTAAVLKAAARRGVEIRAHTPAIGILQDGQHCAGIVTRQERITARQAVISGDVFRDR